MEGNSQDGSSGNRTEQSGGTAGGGGGGGGGGSSGSGSSASYHYQPPSVVGSGSSGSNPPAGSGSSASNPSYHSSGSGSGAGNQSGSGSGSGAGYQSGSGSGSGSGAGYYQSGSGSGSGSGAGYYQSGSGSRGSEYCQGSGDGSGSRSGGGSGSRSGDGSGDGSKGPRQPGNESQRAVGGSSSDHQSSSDTKQSSSSRTGSSVTWHDKVTEEPPQEDSGRISSSLFDGETSVKTVDSNRSSIRRFKEGSKIFVGFIEDADGLEPSDDMLPPMTWEEKCEIIEELCFALEKRLDRLKNEKDGILDGLKNYYDVAEHICGMARKDRVEMQRNVIQFAELLNPSKKAYSEDMFRYLNGRIYDKRTLKEKLEVRNKRLEKMVATATEHLESKLDVRELLHDSDFMEMRKVNEDLEMQLNFRARLLEKNRQVSRKIAKTTKEMREKMEKTAEAKVSIRQSLSDRSPLVTKLQALIELELKERDRLHHEHLAFVKGEDLTPTALDYMKIRQRSKSVRKELYNWLAKMEIAELKHNQLTKNIAMLEAVKS